MLTGPGPVLTYRPLENAAQVIISEVIICAEMSEVRWSRRRNICGSLRFPQPLRRACCIALLQRAEPQDEGITVQLVTSSVVAFAAGV